MREVDPYGEGPHTWKVESERVKQVRADGFTFNRIVGFGKIYRYHQLGIAYHRTPEDALRAFIAARQEQIKSAQRAIAEAERAIAWAEGATPAQRPARQGEP